MGFFKILLNKRNYYQLFIGKGVFVTRNSCVPIAAISRVNVIESQKPSIGPDVGCLIVGVLFLLLNSFLHAIGIFLIVIGCILLMLHILLAIIMEHHLQIQVHSGAVYDFPSRDLDYLRNVLKLITDEIMNGSNKFLYVDASTKISRYVEEINYNMLKEDHSEKTFQIKGDAFFDNQGVVIKDKAKVEHSNINGSGSDIKQEIGGVSSEEWDMVLQFLRKRYNELEDAPKDKENTLALYQAAKKHDVPLFKRVFNALGKESIKIIFMGAEKFIIDTVVKIIESKI